jgi:hypothetical protein
MSKNSIREILEESVRTGIPVKKEEHCGERAYDCTLHNFRLFNTGLSIFLGNAKPRSSRVISACSGLTVNRKYNVREGVYDAIVQNIEAAPYRHFTVRGLRSTASGMDSSGRYSVGGGNVGTGKGINIHRQNPSRLAQLAGPGDGVAGLQTVISQKPSV